MREVRENKFCGVEGAALEHFSEILKKIGKENCNKKCFFFQKNWLKLRLKNWLLQKREKHIRTREKFYVPLFRLNFLASLYTLG